jgi:transposase
MWKLALKDAFETVEKYWLSLADALRQHVAAQRKRGHFTEPEAHYCFWVLCSSQLMAKLVSGRAPIPSRFSLSHKEHRRARNYLRRVIRRKRGKNPRGRKARSFPLDSGMYRIFFEKGRQYLSITTLVPGQRLVIPLTGGGKIQGNLRIVLDEEKRRVEVHQTREVKRKQARGAPQGIDLGVTEVFTDSDGDRWGEGFGRLLLAYSDLICEKGRKRNKLFALARKAEERGDKVKARRILRYNLGRKKQRRVRRRLEETLNCKINRSLNEFWKAKAPRVLAHENLGHLQGKFKSRQLSRLVSFWVRGLVKERLIFKASAGGSRREQVNPSYSSQMCARCWFVHPRNRQGDRFQCLFCGHGGDSDAVAAWNLLDRLDDPEILLWTPKEQVKAIFLKRFRRRLERWDFDFSPFFANFLILKGVDVEIPPTVPGKTPGTDLPGCGGPVPGLEVGQPESETPSAAIRQRAYSGQI